MTNISDAARSEGDLMYRIAALERRVQQLQTARRLEAAQVGRGGIRITGGGSLLVEDGGGVTIDDGGTLNVDGPASIDGETTIGGNVEITDGGSLEVDGQLDVNGPAVIGGTLDVTGPTRLDGTTNIGGNVTLEDGASLEVDGQLDVNGPANIDGTTRVGGDMLIEGGGTLGVDGQLSVDGPATISGNTTIDGNTTLDGDTDVQGNMAVIGNGEIKSSNFNGDTRTGDPGTQGWALGNQRLALRGSFIPAIDSSSHEAFEEFFSINTTEDDKAVALVTVPDWAATASVMITCMFAWANTSGGSRQVTMRPRIGSDRGRTITWTLDDGGANVWSIPHSRTFDVTGTSSFGLAGEMFTDSGSVPGHEANACTVTGLVMFRSAT